MQPDCVDQLRNFLNEKNKYFNDYEKNSSLKFCSPIQIPNNEALHLNEFSKRKRLYLQKHH